MKNVFISYKSEDSNFVRQIVDLLIASGSNVWFAEYDVLSKNYDDFDKNLDEELTAAIKSCQYAIIFSNNLWNESSHCRNERNQILSQLSKEHIIQVCLPKETEHHIYIQHDDAIPTIEYTKENAEQVVQFIRNHLKLTTEAEELSLEDPGDENNRLTFRYGSMELGRFLWKGANPNLGPVGQEHELIFAANFSGIENPVRLEINIDPYNSMITDQEYMFAQNSPKDHREIYRRLRERATSWYAKHKLNEGGLHLYWSGSRSHIGLTYKTDYSTGRHSWTRLYSLTFKDDESDKVVTCIFELKTIFEKNEELDSFKKFCGLTYYLDRMVSSFQYKSDPSLAFLSHRMDNKLQLYVGYIIGGIGIPGYYLYSHYPDAIKWWALGTAIVGGLIGGFILGNFLENLKMKPYLDSLTMTSGIHTGKQGFLPINQHWQR